MPAIAGQDDEAVVKLKGNLIGRKLSPPHLDIAPGGEYFQRPCGVGFAVGVLLPYPDIALTETVSVWRALSIGKAGALSGQYRFDCWTAEDL